MEDNDYKRWTQAISFFTNIHFLSIIHLLLKPFLLFACLFIKSHLTTKTFFVILNFRTNTTFESRNQSKSLNGPYIGHSYNFNPMKLIVKISYKLMFLGQRANPSSTSMTTRFFKHGIRIYVTDLRSIRKYEHWE